MSQSANDRKRINNAVHRFYGHISGKPPMIEETLSAPRQKREPQPNAAPLEREVLKACWQYLAHHPKVAWVTRINSGALMADFGAGGTHLMRLNYKRGMSDLIGQLKTGQFLAVECKREGVSLQDHQRDFLNEVLHANGVAFVARCVEDCEEGLR